MEADSFFSRWSRRKQEARELESRQAAVPADPAAKPAPVLSPVADSTSAVPLPTMADVARLTPDSDFKPFLARGVEEAVKRSAMKKLFADPHFNIMDGLDVYIDDYSKFEPIPPEMLARLEHAKALLDPLAQLENPLQGLLDPQPADAPETAEAAPDAALQTEAQAESDATPPSAPDQASHDDPI